MSAPRHLWSGDWRDESSALAEELAARRAEGVEAPAAEPVAAPPPAPKARRRRRRPPVRLPRVDPRRLRTGLLVALLTLLIVGGAYALASSGSSGPSPSSPTASSGSAAWLGIDMSSSQLGGVIVVGVAPHSPAQAAGIKPGDMITQIDTEPIAAPSIVEAAIAGLRPGDQVEIELQRGSTTYTTRATLATPPNRNP